MFYKSVLFSYRAGTTEEPKMNIGHLDPGDQGPKVLDKESWFKGQKYHLGGGLQVAEYDFQKKVKAKICNFFFSFITTFKRSHMPTKKD